MKLYSLLPAAAFLAISIATSQAPLQIATVASGDLVKCPSFTSVYYVGADLKRYVFPNEKTYFTWYPNFSTVKTITCTELGGITIGGNVTYRPGVKLVKIQTDPKVYVVSKGGTLRHITSEAVAASLYGSDWNKKIDDIPDGFFVNYKIGADINTPPDYNPTSETTAVTTINQDKGIGI